MTPLRAVAELVKEAVEKYRNRRDNNEDCTCEDDHGGCWYYLSRDQKDAERVRWLTEELVNAMEDAVLAGEGDATHRAGYVREILDVHARQMANIVNRAIRGSEQEQMDSEDTYEAIRALEDKAVAKLDALYAATPATTEEKK